MNEKQLALKLIRAIHKNCYDCSGRTECEVKECSLYDYRPYHKQIKQLTRF